MRQQFIACPLLLILFSSFCLAMPPDPSLKYQWRGDRNEGVKQQPVSSYDIDLLSATAYREPKLKVPDKIKLRFFFGKPDFPNSPPTTVSITVREIDNKYYYWMDHTVTHRAPGLNDYAWPTLPVLRPLHANDGLDLSGLGIVVNLGSSLPTGSMTVAPVILYYGTLPSAVTEYEFDFKTDQDARMEASVYSAVKPHEVYSQPFPRVTSNTPFSVRWPCGNEPDGAYRLVVKGYALDSNDPIEITVNFHHRNLVK